MERILAAVILSGAMLMPASTARAQSEQLESPASASLKSGELPANLGELPPGPRGKSTIFGGEIRSVDPVRDELTLKVYGERPMKILFDERTLVYLDGKRIPLHELGPEDHAAVETTLDGTNVFAVNVHLLSRSPQGDYEGRVVSYNPATGELTIASSASREPFTVLVARDASFKREGQPGFSSVGSGPRDLQKGSLISVEFQPGQAGRGVASSISVLAVPGAAFAFSGNIASLDLHSGSLVLIDPRDQKSYQISFDSHRVPANLDLHLGEHVSVKAAYDGAHYVANQITAD
jgi:hypothetical protein